MRFEKDCKKSVLIVEEYFLSLDVNFYSLEFTGHERVKIKNPEKDIALDSLDLKIEQVSTNGGNLRFEADTEAKKLMIYDLPTNSSSSSLLEIDIDYTGKITEKTLYGFYKSRYGSDYFVTTDFEPNGARVLLPCIDNPVFKAVFSLEVTTQKDLVVVSNGKLKTTLDQGNSKTKHIFESTPKMSTYILYLGIGKFDQASLKERNLEFRVSARPGYAEKGRFALENATRFLKAYEDYYSIPYPLEKLDLIGLPEYASGAMENWGAITFREVVLLVDNNSSVGNKRNVTSVLGHEIAHMWFGNLVTMRWWNDLWLNESFATFMESKITNELYPEWNVVSDFVQQTTASAMNSDSLSNTHAIDVPVKAPEEISQIFDDISYGKGASVLRMIESWIGQDSFRIGVSSYLSEFKYGNAEGKDLWRHLATASGKPVNEVMEDWVKYAGFPVVSVSVNQGKLSFSQERFFLDTKKSECDGAIWPIPISYIINGTENKFLLKDKSFEFPDKIDEITIVKVNYGQTGFYRTLYDRNLYPIIEKEFLALGIFDRWGILADLFAFLVAGKITLDQYLSFSRRTADESEYLVADAVTSHLQFLRFISPENKEIMQVYRAHYSSQIRRLGLEAKSEEKDTDKLLRGRIATGLALVDEDFARNLSNEFSNYERLDPNLRTAVAVSYAQIKGSSGYDELVSTMKRLGSEAEIVKIYLALTSFKDQKLVEKTLDLCISGEISRADSLYAVIDATQNPYARGMTWEWFKSNLGVFRELFRGTPYVSQLLQEVISKAGIGREEDVRNYVASFQIPEGDKGIKKGIELLGIYSSLKRRL